VPSDDDRDGQPDLRNRRPAHDVERSAVLVGLESHGTSASARRQSRALCRLTVVVVPMALALW
jgi:hypothetical protein